MCITIFDSIRLCLSHPGFTFAVSYIELIDLLKQLGSLLDLIVLISLGNNGKVHLNNLTKANTINCL